MKPYPLAGGCDCRHIRYQLEERPLFVHCCHCRWCQRETGASFALNAMIEADRVTLLGAEPELVDTTASKQPWVLLPPGTPAVPVYYDSAQYWPPESLARRDALRAKIAAQRQS